MSLADPGASSISVAGMCLRLEMPFNANIEQYEFDLSRFEKLRKCRHSNFQASQDMI